jgi:CRP/FNR family cyclic AMP-dependent transcriptional regulator
MSDHVNALKSIPLLAGLPHSDLERLAKKVREERHGPGAELIKEGTSGSSVYLIVSGQCEVRRSGTRINSLGAGEFFGELSILDPSPRTASVSVTEAAVLLVLEGYEFRTALSSNMQMSQQLIRVLAARLRHFTDEFAPRAR